MEEDKLVISSSRIGDKYNKTIWSGALFVFIGALLIYGVFSYAKINGEYDKDHQTLLQILPFLLIFIPGYGLALIRQSTAEKKLSRDNHPDINSGLVLNKEGIYGSIALLEGPLRDYIRDTLKQGAFYIEWDEMEKFIVEPSQGKNGDAPPYYKITLKGQGSDMGASYFILRTYFTGQENKLLDYAKMRLTSEQIVLNDDLSPETKENQTHGG